MPSVFFSALIALSLSLTSCGSSKSASVSNYTQSQMPSGEQVLATFCMDEAYDMPGEYMAGFGISEDCLEYSQAVMDACKAAIVDIAARYVKVIENTITYYTEETNLPNGQKIYESLQESETTAIGSKVIDKFANIVCQKVFQNVKGNYGACVVVHIPLENAKNELAEELVVRKMDYDKEKFFEKLQLQLDAAAAKQKEELDAMMK